MSTIWCWYLWWVSALVAGRLFHVGFSGFLCQRLGRAVLLWVGWGCLSSVLNYDARFCNGIWAMAEFRISEIKILNSKGRISNWWRQFFPVSSLGWLLLERCSMQLSEWLIYTSLRGFSPCPLAQAEWVIWDQAVDRGDAFRAADGTASILMKAGAKASIWKCRKQHCKLHVNLKK